MGKLEKGEVTARGNLRIADFENLRPNHTASPIGDNPIKFPTQLNSQPEILKMAAGAETFSGISLPKLTDTIANQNATVVGMSWGSISSSGSGNSGFHHHTSDFRAGQQTIAVQNLARFHTDYDAALRAFDYAVDCGLYPKVGKINQEYAHMSLKDRARLSLEKLYQMQEQNSQLYGLPIAIIYEHATDEVVMLSDLNYQV